MQAIGFQITARRVVDELAHARGLQLLKQSLQQRVVGARQTRFGQAPQRAARAAFDLEIALSGAHVKPVEFERGEIEERWVAPVCCRLRQAVAQRGVGHEHAVRTDLLQVELFTDGRFRAEQNVNFPGALLNHHGRLRRVQAERGQPARLRQQVLRGEVSAPVEGTEQTQPIVDGGGLRRIRRLHQPPLVVGALGANELDVVRAEDLDAGDFRGIKIREQFCRLLRPLFGVERVPFKQKNVRAQAQCHDHEPECAFGIHRPQIKASSLAPPRPNQQPRQKDGSRHGSHQYPARPAHL